MIKESKVLNIIAIKTDNGYYITEETDNSYDKYIFPKYIFDRELPSKTFAKKWGLIQNEPKKIEKEVSHPDINHRYELKDFSMMSKKIPKIFKREDVVTYDSEEYSWDWKDEYSHLRSLYELKSDKQPNTFEEIDFNFKVIIEIDDIKEYAGFSYPVQKTQWKHDGLTNITEKDIDHQLIDKIVFPEIILSSRPSCLTSKQSYDIVRQYIKQNLNYEVAFINSDYDFCFSVHKRILLNEPYISKKEILTRRGKSYRPPRYNIKNITKKSVEVFEMTYSPENYKRYTPLPGFEGKNQDDLKEKIDKYCEDLLKKINEPLKECSHCNGLGVILDNK